MLATVVHVFVEGVVGESDEDVRGDDERVVDDLLGEYDFGFAGAAPRFGSVGGGLDGFFAVVEGGGFAENLGSFDDALATQTSDANFDACHC